jgi:isopentenyl-diphosphate delta-isomerase
MLLTIRSPTKGISSDRVNMLRIAMPNLYRRFIRFEDPLESRGSRPFSTMAMAMTRSDTSLDDVILVDDGDRAIGTAAKLPAHREGLLHRAISVIVRDHEGRLLLQKRAAGKYHSAGLWTNTCCSHPRPGEPTADAAARRLSEEMGVDCALIYLFPMRYRADVSEELVENEITHIFGGVFNGMPDPDPAEASEWRWMSLDEIARDMENRPDAYTIWFRKMCRDFREDLRKWIEDRASRA